MKLRYKSEAMEPVYEIALANFEIGAISEERFHEYERACLVPETPVAQTAKSSGASSIPMKRYRVYASKAD
jgi:DNA-binding transcriptional regulator YiaG